MKAFKVCYVSSEVTPFVKTVEANDLAKTSGALPAALKEMEQDVRLMMPKYKSINERKFVLREVIRLREMEIKLGKKDLFVNGKTAFLPYSKVHVYFLSVPEYFDRKGCYQDLKTGEVFADNAERFGFFCKSVLETLKLLYWQPDIIHCSDWPTALIPYYLKTQYKGDDFFQNTRTVLTVHNLNLQGQFSVKEARKIGIDAGDIKPGGGAELNGKLNFLKAGLDHADVINLTSEYERTHVLAHPEAAFGLGEILSRRKKDVFGIAGGMDDSLWNPEEDSVIATKYEIKTLANRTENKARLLEELGCAREKNTPFLGIILDFNNKDALQLTRTILPDLLKKDICILLINDNESRTEVDLSSLADQSKGKLIIRERMDKRLGHLLMAGADIIFIPTESGGDGFHLKSLRYGAVPVTPSVGEISDCIRDFSAETGKGNGFRFSAPGKTNVLAAINRALKTLEDPNVWAKLQKNGMKGDYSWRNTARKYLKLYETAMKK